MNKNTTHKSVAIDSIEVADRLRDDYGDVLGLAEDIKRNGLLHGIVVEETGDTSAPTFYRLLAGERRLRACRSLGWKEIQAKVYSDLTDEERLDIEVSENTKRKGLTEGELAKRTKLVERAEEVLGACPKTSPKGGRPPNKGASKEKIAAKVGVSRKTLQRDERHAKALAEFPELAGLSQKAALKEYDKRTKAPKPPRPAPAPEVVKVSEYSLDGTTRGRMDLLVKDHGFGTYTKVISSAVEHLLNTLTEGSDGNDTEDILLGRKKAPVSKPERPAGQGPNFQPGDLCEDGRKGKICATTLHQRGHHPACVSF